MIENFLSRYGKITRSFDYMDKDKPYWTTSKDNPDGTFSGERFRVYIDKKVIGHISHRVRSDGDELSKLSFGINGEQILNVEKHNAIFWAYAHNEEISLDEFKKDYLVDLDSMFPLQEAFKHMIR